VKLPRQCGAETVLRAFVLVSAFGCRLLVSGLAEGSLQGVVGKLLLSAINVGPLKAAVAAAEALEGLSDSTRSVLACAHIILRLRLSVLAGDNNGIRKVGSVQRGCSFG
jgi:hypothetical protein